jgi:hypothetical protein
MDSENTLSKSQKAKSAYVAQKTRVISHYGGRCNCCGEKELIFLTIDHINEDGAEHRRSLTGTRAGGSNSYRDIIKNNFPNTYQVLCFNCNHAKHVLGECWHKTKAAMGGCIEEPLEAQSTRYDP